MSNWDRVRASAPGKFILFGEHAVVYGEPSLSLALDRRVTVSAQRRGGAISVNGATLNSYRHAYIEAALKSHWSGGGLRIRTRSRLPSASGLGSSAALSVATVAALMALESGAPPKPSRVAKAAFEAELRVQGAASPNDTTASTHGQGVFLAPEPEAGLPRLWKIQRNQRTWIAHHVDAPPVSFVVAHSGQRGRTADQVALVKKRVDAGGDALKSIRRIGQITREGRKALQQNDLQRVGRLMDENHEHLARLGVETDRLAALVQASRKAPGTLGAKLTGAGGGGSMIVLTTSPPEAKRALERVQAPAWIINVGGGGLEVEG